MSHYDVIVIGAGPAGAHCARLLARSCHVLLVEKCSNFTENNFSTAGAPLSILQEFQLPEEVVGSYWNKIAIATTGEQALWEGKEALGVVLDFAKLRTFLTKEVTQAGAEVKMGHTYLRYSMEKEKVNVYLKERQTRQETLCTAKVLVDATGASRAVLSQPTPAKRFSATGIERLIEVEASDYTLWANQLTFFLGQKWMPQGYSWIFPMQPNQLKVGIGRYFPKKQFVPHNNSYQYYLDLLVQECIKGKSTVLDRHGKTLSYTYGQKDLMYKGAVIAIGDAVSSVNPLAFEGIRHAMANATLATDYIFPYLNGDCSNFASYARAFRRSCCLKWRIAEFLMDRIYKQPNDNKLNRMLRALKPFSIDQMYRFCFNYTAKEALTFYGRYLLL